MASVGRVEVEAREAGKLVRSISLNHRGQSETLRPMINYHSRRKIRAIIENAWSDEFGTARHPCSFAFAIEIIP